MRSRVVQETWIFVLTSSPPWVSSHSGYVHRPLRTVAAELTFPRSCLTGAHIRRCQCHGHAAQCDTASRPYRCLCAQDSFTTGLHVSSPFHAWGSPKRGGVVKVVTVKSLNLLSV